MTRPCARKSGLPTDSITAIEDKVAAISTHARATAFKSCTSRILRAHRRRPGMAARTVGSGGAAGAVLRVNSASRDAQRCLQRAARMTRTSPCCAPRRRTERAARAPGATSRSHRAIACAVAPEGTAARRRGQIPLRAGRAARRTRPPRRDTPCAPGCGAGVSTQAGRHRAARARATATGALTRADGAARRGSGIGEALFVSAIH